MIPRSLDTLDRMRLSDAVRLDARWCTPSGATQRRYETFEAIGPELAIVTSEPQQDPTHRAGAESGGDRS